MASKIKIFIGIVSLCGFLISALGLGGTFSSPQIGFSESTNHKLIPKVSDFVKKELKFVEGSFINEHQTQSFYCSAESLTKFVKLLGIAGFQLKIAFYQNPKEEHITFRFYQNFGAPESNIFINLASKDFELKNLSLAIPSTYKPQGNSGK